MADKKSNRVKITTPKGIAVYPRLNKPDTKFKAEGVYSVRLRLSAEAAAPIIKQIDAMAAQHLVDTTAMLEAKVEEATGAAKVKLQKEWEKLELSEDKPYRAALDKDTGEETGDFEFNFKMNATFTDRNTKVTKPMAPKLVDAKGNDASGVQVWGGSEVQIGGYLSPFYVAKTGVGVSLRLSTVRIVKLVSGGGDSFDFDDDAGDDDFVAPAPKREPMLTPAEAEALEKQSAGGTEPDEF